MRHCSEYSLRGRIKRALEAARMKDAGFDMLSWREGQELPKDESEVTEFIKKRTENYRQSWIIAPLEEALKRLEKKKD